MTLIHLERDPNEMLAWCGVNRYDHDVLPRPADVTCMDCLRNAYTYSDRELAAAHISERRLLAALEEAMPLLDMIERDFPKYIKESKLLGVSTFNRQRAALAKARGRHER